MTIYYLLEAIDWLNPAVHLVGLVVAIWAFRRCRKRGYLVVAVYFALAVLSFIATPKINQIIAERRGPDLSEEMERRMNEAVQETIREFREDGGNQVFAATRNMDFPLGPIILVAGLWLISRNETIGTTEQQAAGDGSATPEP